MAEENDNDQDRTEEPTPERQEEFRERGQVAVSRELTSVIVLAAGVVTLSFITPLLINRLSRTMVSHFQQLSTLRIDKNNIHSFAQSAWTETLFIIIPVFLLTVLFAIFSTFAQTRMNFSWQKLAPDFSRMALFKGIGRMFSGQALVELGKGIAKMATVGLVSYLILKSEWAKLPSLLIFPLNSTWAYWASITKYLFWATSAVLLVVAGLDYFYNYIVYLNRIKMTKQEVKEEYKRREVDPQVKGRIRRMQREIANRKMIDKTKAATVLITNPTHFAIALQYDLGMSAPVVVAKGADFLALRMREAAKEANVPIVENPPLARTLYKIVELGREIPTSLYKAVSEVIRYIFQKKGIKLDKGSIKNRVSA